MNINLPFILLAVNLYTYCNLVLRYFKVDLNKFTQDFSIFIVLNYILESLRSTGKAVGFRMETATIDSLQNLLMSKLKVVHLSCHGEFDRAEDNYYLAFESKKIMGMMEKLSMNQLKTLFTTQIKFKSIECVVVSACHSQKIGELMRDSGVPVVICINAPFKIQDEAAR